MLKIRNQKNLRWDSRALEPLTEKVYRMMMTQDIDPTSCEEVEEFVGDLLRSGVTINAFDHEPKTRLEQAQRMMWEAFGEARAKKRVQLAQKALTVSRDCADAYVLLAEERKSLKEKIVLYKRGVEAGKRALGEEALSSKATQWGVDLETRPYLRAMAGLACCLLEDGQLEDGIAVSKEILRLDSSDSQMVRLNLMCALLMTERDADIEELLSRFCIETSAHMLYSRALYIFKKHGKGPLATRTLREAYAANPHVFEFILQRRSLSDHPDEEMGDFGGYDEALLYVSSGMKLWAIVPGAIEWLIEFRELEVKAAKQEQIFPGAKFESILGRLTPAGVDVTTP